MPQSISYSICCKFFRHMLPKDREGKGLEAGIFRREVLKRCAVCGKLFSSVSNSVKYCGNCKAAIQRQQKAGKSGLFGPQTGKAIRYYSSSPGNGVLFFTQDILWHKKHSTQFYASLNTRRGLPRRWKPTTSGQRNSTPAIPTLTREKAKTIFTLSSPRRNTVRKSTAASRRRGAKQARPAPCLWTPSSPPARSSSQAGANRRCKPISPRQRLSWKGRSARAISSPPWYTWTRKRSTFISALPPSPRTGDCPPKRLR